MKKNYLVRMSCKVALVLCFQILTAHNFLYAQSDGNSIIIKSFGGRGGNFFPEVSIRSVGVEGDRYVDKIIINSVSHGGDGGQNNNQLVLNDDEYISGFSINSENYIDNVYFFTNKGRRIGAGGNGGQRFSVGNIRVLGISGRASKYVDQLQIKYIANYIPSAIVQRAASFIISFNPPHTQFEKYTDRKSRNLDTYEKISEVMSRQAYSASIVADYFAKASVSTELEFKTTNTTNIKQEMERQLASGEKQSVALGGDEIGVTIVSGNLMRSSDGQYWMYPIADPQYIVLKLSDYANLLGKYDLTYELYSQLPALKNTAVNKNGYLYYQSIGTIR